MASQRDFYTVKTENSIATKSVENGRVAAVYEKGQTSGNRAFDDFMSQASNLLSSSAILDAVNDFYNKSAFKIAQETMVKIELNKLERQFEKKGLSPLTTNELDELQKLGRDSWVQGFSGRAFENPDDPDEYTPDVFDKWVDAYTVAATTMAQSGVLGLDGRTAASGTSNADAADYGIGEYGEQGEFGGTPTVNRNDLQSDYYGGGVEEQLYAETYGPPPHFGMEAGLMDLGDFSGNNSGPAGSIPDAGGTPGTTGNTSYSSGSGQYSEYRDGHPAIDGTHSSETTSSSSSSNNDSGQFSGYRIQDLYQQLEAEQPGRYKLMTAEEDAVWKAEFDEKHQSAGIGGDIKRLLTRGIGSADEGAEYVLDKIPVIGPALNTAINTAYELVHGKNYQQARDEMVERATATLTPEQREASEKQWVVETPGQDGSVSFRTGPAWMDPRSYMGVAVESIPATVMTMVPGGVMARGAFLSAVAKGATRQIAGKQAARTAMIASGITEGLLGGGEAAIQVRDQIADLPREVLEQSDAFQQLLAGGLSPEQALEALSNDAETQAFFMAGVATAVFGGQGDRVLVKIFNEGVSGGLIKRTARGAVRGTIAEGVLEEAPQGAAQQIATNLAVQNADPSQRTMEGVPNAVAGGLVGGGLVGGGLGGGSGDPATEIPDSSADPANSAPQTPPAAPERPKGALSRARDHGAEREAARAATTPPDASPQTEAQVLNSQKFQPGATVIVDTGRPGTEPFMATVDSVDGDDVIVFDATTGQLLQIPARLLSIASPPPGQPDTSAKSENIPESPEVIPESGNDIGDAPENIASTPQEPETPAPPLDKPVDVNAPPPVADIDNQKAVVLEPATEPAKLPPAPQLEIDATSEPNVPTTTPEVVKPAPAPRQVVVNNKQASFPDPDHADLYALGEKIVRARRNSKSTTTRIDQLLAKDRKLIAHQLGIAEDKVREVADDYRYRVERAARTADNGRFNAPRLNAKLLARFQAERDTEVAATIEEAAKDAATSPENNLPEPTQAQKEAGNYRMGHVRLGGMNLSIENPAGSTRSGTAADGTTWSVDLQSHYGYILETEGKDKDHIDIFVKPGTKRLGARSPVFVVDQINDKGDFDEHKAMAGYKTEKEARAAYLANYTSDWDGLGAITRAPLDDFKSWLKTGNTKQPFAGQKSGQQARRENQKNSAGH